MDKEIDPYAEIDWRPNAAACAYRQMVLAAKRERWYRRVSGFPARHFSMIDPPGYDGR